MTNVAERVGSGLVCELDDPHAVDPELVGSKAASLARSRRDRLPVVPGFAVTTAVHAAYLSGGHKLPGDAADAIVAAWDRLTDGGRVPVVARSSSTVEDIGASSMAGRFRTVLNVQGREDLLTAVADVFNSGDEVGDPDHPSPMGVLVQRHVDPSRGGVMFGVDPVTGAKDRIVVEAVAGGPDKLVSGRVTAQHYVMTRSGRLRTLDHQPVHTLLPLHHEQRLLSTGDLFSLAALARHTEKVFGSPQDVEWAIETDGTLLLLQSRPVTATAPVAPGKGPVLGPGPLGETFPDPLCELEVDLWVRPLREGVVEALREASAVPRAHIDRSPVVLTVSGRVAADLELFGYVPNRSPLGILDPRPAFRQLGAAWHTGLIRGQLPQRAAELVAEVDAALADLDPSSATDAELVGYLELGRTMLKRLHQSEVLAGTLLPASPVTSAAMALKVLHDASMAGAGADVVRRHPILLCLVPPSLQGEEVLPAPPAAPPALTVQPLAPRESLRVRIRWVQEMTARVFQELDRRLMKRDVLLEPGTLALLRLEEIHTLLEAGTLPEDLHERRSRELTAALSAPLPAQFRLAEDGTPVPVARAGARPGAGVAAGGGRGVGQAVHGSTRRPPSAGDVLIVRELQPGLAAYLPGLAGLVAETGSTLSHLAILAREYDVPTVVAVHDALRRFPPGSRVFVDGATGEVRLVSGEIVNGEEGEPS